MNNALIDFSNSKVDEQNVRETAWGQVQGIQSILDAVDTIINDGIKAEKETAIEPEETGPQETN